MDLPLSIVASDNVSVTSVEVTYSVNGEDKTIAAERVSGNHLSGTYTATIPGEDIDTRNPAIRRLL